ncbi:MAG: hypothetical protein LKI22_03300 [Liquorilactobacillus nagelii]|jgi:hypothetical protein|uniref:hypothetical protein n=1 Tax=Liquorilactobacillus nagelii TaxID=82688 RepID=UPI0024323187|nr:hypothetical protein [Liquorilactobacillus nagelii]MCI1632964.1 hypothetical protein [Liquorilactobacillus nagelii]
MKTRELVSLIVLLPVFWLTRILFYPISFVILLPLFLLFNAGRIFIYLNFKHCVGFDEIIETIREGWV